jgi:glyoxylase-like metal-dependent hydrolase (beta-lactamase superfamily II)
MKVAKEVVPGLYQVNVGAANVFLIDSGDAGLALVDTGFPKNASNVEEGIRSLGRNLSDVTDILITHAHPDHLGSAARLGSVGVPVSMPADEAWIARAGRVEQTMSPTPGLINRIMFRLFVGNEPYDFPAFDPERGLVGGEHLDIAGGIEVLHTPGHSADHISLLWKRDRNVLLTGDAVKNVPGLGYSIGYDDFEKGKQSAARLGQLEFEVAVFGHGKPILSNASKKFASKFK